MITRVVKKVGHRIRSKVPRQIGDGWRSDIQGARSITKHPARQNSWYSLCDEYMDSCFVNTSKVLQCRLWKRTRQSMVCKAYVQCGIAKERKSLHVHTPSVVQVDVVVG